MLEAIFFIAIAALAAVFFFTLIEDWYDIGSIDPEDPEDP